MTNVASDAAFRRQVLAHYQQQGRHDLPWRQPAADGRFDPYKILVSEVMLQQTQVPRVVPKFQAFIGQYPDFAALAAAPLGDVLRAWNGLGYNRRAKFLHETARTVVADYGGRLPTDPRVLATLPGIGRNTAGAVTAYAFNQPAVFVETNIRTAVIHHYFAGQTGVDDAAILEKVARTLPKTDMRTWYWALMDYGSHLKQTVGNLSRAGRSYARQSAFQGSRRQIRGQVIRLLGDRPKTEMELRSAVADERLDGVLADLLQERLIHRSKKLYHL